MNQVENRLKKRYGYAWIVLKGLVKTDFKLRYQGSFLGVLWSVLKPLLLFVVMYFVFARFLRMTDGTPTYPVVLLAGISSWQFVTESVNTGLRSIVDRGDLLRKIHFPNYIVVVSATVGALISYAINLLVVLVFAVALRVNFTWWALLLPLNIIELYAVTLAMTLIMATMYAYFRDLGSAPAAYFLCHAYYLPVKPRLGEGGGNEDFCETGTAEPYCPVDTGYQA